MEEPASGAETVAGCGQLIVEAVNAPSLLGFFTQEEAERGGTTRMQDSVRIARLSRDQGPACVAGPATSIATIQRASEN